MASRPKSGSSQGRRNAPRSRKPATIDLEAREVADESKAGETPKKSSPTGPKTGARSTAAKASATKSASTTSEPASKPAQKPAETSKETTKKEASASPAQKKPDPDNGARANTAKEKGDGKRNEQAKPARAGNGLVSGLTGAVAAVLVLGVLGQFDGAKNIPVIGSLYGGGSEATLAAQNEDLNSLRAQVAKLTAERADSSSVSDRVSELEALIRESDSGGIDPAVGEKFDAIEKELQGIIEQVSGGIDLAEVDEAIARANENIKALQSAASSNTISDFQAAVDEKLNVLSDKLDGLRSDVTKNSESLTALISQSGELESTVASVKASEKVARSVAANALGTALENDDPLGLPISSLEALVGQTPETMRLAELDAEGIPSLKDLAANLDAFTNTIDGTDGPGEDASLSDRFWANAQSLVSFRSTGPREGDDPLSILSRVKADVASGNLLEAKAEWEKLPKEMQDKGVEWSAQLLKRLEAHTLYEAISEQLAAAAG